MQLNPRVATIGFLDTYLVSNGGATLELVHRTSCNEVPGALCAHQGRLLASVGKVLRLYDLGKKKLLRKCENKVIIKIEIIYLNRIKL